MQIYAKLDPITGRLSEISWREPGPGDVPLVAMPLGEGPWTYDAVGQLAVSAPLGEGERLDRVEYSPRVRAALLIRASSRWADLTPRQKARVMAIIDTAATAAVAALT